MSNLTPTEEMTDTEMANAALAMVGIDPLNSILDVTKIASVVRRIFPIVVYAVLRKRAWNCAIRRQTLNPVTAPAGEWKFTYQLPTDPYCLRPLRLENKAPFRVEGRLLRTNSGEAKLVYVARIQANEMDSLLFDATTTRLAAELAVALARDPGLAQNLMAAYESKIRVADGVDAAEGGMEQRTSRDFINARF